MPSLLAAASPVEITALAAEQGLPPPVREAALALFHELTSTLELAEIGLARRRATDWPAHRFWFAVTPGALAPLLDGLGREPEALRLHPDMPAGAVGPATLWLDAERDGHQAVLVACADPDGLSRWLSTEA